MWLLDPNVTYLNHGSFGATPTAVMDEATSWRRLLETNPVRFFAEEYPPAIARARAVVAEFVGARADRLGFVSNATAAANAVIRSVLLSPGDEIIVTDHGYNACTNAARAEAGRRGATVEVVRLPFIPESPDEVVDRIVGAVTPATRLVIVDHVTSPTALRLPVAEIVARLEPDIAVLVDGAHAPGMLDLDVEEIGASFYVGNLHKWVCAPKGAGFVAVADRWVNHILPPVISHGWDAEQSGVGRVAALFDWMGTDEPSSRLSTPKAIEVMAEAFGGWPDIRAGNRALALEGRSLISEKTGLDQSPSDQWVGSMVAMLLPGSPVGSAGMDDLTVRLRHGHAIEVPVFAWNDQRVLRFSAQRYNTLADYERLADALTLEMGAD